MNFSDETTVMTADGEKVGTVDELVIDPRSQDVTHIVVEKGFLFSEDRVIPVENLRQADEETIVLREGTQGLEEFPAYEQSYFVSYQRDSLAPQWGNWAGSPLFYYPPVGARPYSFHTGYPNAGAGVVEREGKSVPHQSVMVDEGTKVVTSDGEHAGDVEKTYTDDDGNVTHILISKGLIFSTERLIPVDWVTQMEDNSIKLNVTSDVVEDLPEHDS